MTLNCYFSVRHDGNTKIDFRMISKWGQNESLVFGIDMTQNYVKIMHFTLQCLQMRLTSNGVWNEDQLIPCLGRLTWKALFKISYEKWIFGRTKHDFRALHHGTKHIFQLWTLQCDKYWGIQTYYLVHMCMSKVRTRP